MLFATLKFCDVCFSSGGYNCRRFGWAASPLRRRPALLVAGGLWLLTLRHRNVASFLALGGVLFLCGAMAAAGQLILDHATPWRVALPFAFACCVLGFDAWRRWMRSEWGLFGP